MSSSGSHSQEEECPLQDQALQGKQPSLVQSRLRLKSNPGLPSRELDSNETNTRTCNNPSSYTYGSTQIRFVPPSRNNGLRLHPSCISPNAETSRVPSNATRQDIIPPYVSLGAAGQPQIVPFDGLSYPFGMQPGASRMGTGGSIGINQLDLLGIYMPDAFPARDEPAPDLYVGIMTRLCSVDDTNSEASCIIIGCQL